MSQLTDEEKAKLEELKAKYGEDEIAAYCPPGFGLLVITCPSNPACYRQYLNGMRSDKDDAAVMLTWALDCVAYPERAKAQTLFDRKPALATKVSNRGQELAGLGIQELGKL